MTEFTQEQLNQLAVFAGLTVGPNENWYYCNTSSAQMLMFCRRQEWLPHLKPEQADLVLRAMSNRYYIKIDVQLGGHTFVHIINDYESEWWPEAVCLAALELVAKEPSNNPAT